MPDNTFAEIRDRYETEAQPPPFAALVTRRRRRNRGQALAGAAVVALIVAGGVSAAHFRTNGAGATPATRVSASPSASSPDDTPDTSGYFGNLAYGPSGALYALRGVGKGGLVLDRSRDGGATWTALGTALGGANPAKGVQLVVGDDTSMWIITDGILVQRSDDGGRTWDGLPTGAGGSGDIVPTAVYADGTVWTAWNGTLVTDRAGAAPKQSPAPGYMEAIVSIAPIDANHAVIVTQDANADSRWFRTADRNAHWSSMVNPCPSSREPSVAAVPSGGALWAICSDGALGGGLQTKWLRRSFDGGLTWDGPLQLDKAGSDQVAYPFSPTVAWRTGDDSSVYHTIDGVTWTNVGTTGPAGGPESFAARSGTQAAYVDSSTGLLYVTDDGGQTWTHHHY